MHFFLKILSGKANSVDPDQTAPSGYVILSDSLVFEILGHLPYYRMYEWRAKAQMILWACAGKSESAHFAHV